MRKWVCYENLTQISRRVRYGLKKPIISKQPGQMEVIIRKTDTGDNYNTENLTREAFWNIYKSGCDEHLVLHQIRESNCYIEELDLIAIYEITTKDFQNFEPFMALELQEKGLDNVKGRFYEDEAFEIREDQLIEFETKFPAKEKGLPRIDINL